MASCMIAANRGSSEASCNLLDLRGDFFMMRGDDGCHFLGVNRFFDTRRKTYSHLGDYL